MAKTVTKTAVKAKKATAEKQAEKPAEKVEPVVGVEKPVEKVEPVVEPVNVVTEVEEPVEVCEGCAYVYEKKTCNYEAGESCGNECVDGSHYCKTHKRSKQALSEGKPRCVATLKTGKTCNKVCETGNLCGMHLKTRARSDAPKCQATVRTKSGGQKGCDKPARDGSKFCKSHTRCHHVAHVDGKDVPCKKTCHSASVEFCIDHDSKVTRCKVAGCSDASTKKGHCELHYKKLVSHKLCAHGKCKKAPKVNETLCQEHKKLHKNPQCEAFVLNSKGGAEQCAEHVAKDDKYCERCRTRFGINDKVLGKEEKAHHMKSFVRLMKIASEMKGGNHSTLKMNSGDRDFAFQLWRTTVMELYETYRDAGKLESLENEPEPDSGTGESESEHSHEHEDAEETDKDETEDDDAPEVTIENIIDQVVKDKGELTFLTTTDRKITVSCGKTGKVSVRVGDEKSKSMTVDNAKKILADGETVKEFVEETDE